MWQTGRLCVTHPILPGKFLVKAKEKVKLSKEGLDQETGTTVSCPSEFFASPQTPI